MEPDPDTDPEHQAEAEVGEASDPEQDVEPEPEEQPNTDKGPEMERDPEQDTEQEPETEPSSEQQPESEAEEESALEQDIEQQEEDTAANSEHDLEQQSDLESDPERSDAESAAEEEQTVEVDRESDTEHESNTTSDQDMGSGRDLESEPMSEPQPQYHIDLGKKPGQQTSGKSIPASLLKIASNSVPVIVKKLYKSFKKTPHEIRTRRPKPSTIASAHSGSNRGRGHRRGWDESHRRNMANSGAMAHRLTTSPHLDSNGRKGYDRSISGRLNRISGGTSSRNRHERPSGKPTVKPNRRAKSQNKSKHRPGTSSRGRKAKNREEGRITTSVSRNKHQRPLGRLTTKPKWQHSQANSPNRSKGRRGTSSRGRKAKKKGKRSGKGNRRG